MIQFLLKEKENILLAEERKIEKEAEAAKEIVEVSIEREVIINIGI